MGKVKILPETNPEPITLMGKMAGMCYGSDVDDPRANYKRGLECLRSGHGRALEFAELYFTLDGYSARVIREFARHVGGLPTFLQESTRYVSGEDFRFILPPSVDSHDMRADYLTHMKRTRQLCSELLEAGVPKEDVAYILPLGMTTKLSCRYNFRTLMDMSHQRMCNRALWEFRELMSDLAGAMEDYSVEWEILAEKLEPKCDYLGYCPEEHSCGRCQEQDNS